MKKVFLTLFASAAFAASSQAVLIDFNSGNTTFTDNFTGTAATPFTWGSAVGVFDQPGPAQGGGVSVSTDTGGANYNYNTSYDLGPGSATNTWTISTFFRTNATTGTSANQIAAVGFGTTNAFEIGTGSVQSLGMSLRYPGSGPAGTVQLAVANNTGTNTNTLQASSFTAASNNWYKLTLELTKTATADTFSLSGSVEDWGSLGTSFGSTVQSFTNQTFTNSSLYSDTSVFAGFFARQTSGNPIQIQAVDNFYVIPEPSIWAILAGGLAAVGFIRRRRRA